MTNTRTTTCRFPTGVVRMNLPKFLLYPFLESHPWCLARWETLRGVLRPFDQPIARPSRYFVDFG
jgi:hypothetical protein